MARFFMHVLDGDGWTHDQEGMELSDLAAAMSEALKGGRDLMAAQVLAGTLDLSHMIVVDDENGQEVHRLPFSEAVTVIGIP